MEPGTPMSTRTKHSPRWYAEQIDIVQRQADDWHALVALALERHMPTDDVLRLVANASEYEGEAERLREEALYWYSIDTMLEEGLY
jgi:hypothetical protein